MGRLLAPHPTSLPVLFLTPGPPSLLSVLPVAVDSLLLDFMDDLVGHLSGHVRRPAISTNRLRTSLSLRQGVGLGFLSFDGFSLGEGWGEAGGGADGLGAGGAMTFYERAEVVDGEVEADGGGGAGRWRSLGLGIVLLGFAVGSVGRHLGKSIEFIFIGSNKN